MNNTILSQNYFTLFNLEINYLVDLNNLQITLRQLQQQYHPDKFANQPTELINQALNVSSYINNAYSVLINPLDRAIYLLQQYSIEVDLVHDTKFSHEFLFQQIELREQIEHAQAQQDIDSLEQIEQHLQNLINNTEIQIGQLFASCKYAEIIEQVKQLAFYTKLIQLVINAY
jgi:molecular chaperone HscB